jgi:MATE family multidrug resistance protein
LAAIGLAAIFMSAMVIIIIIFRHVIPLVFLGAEAANAGATVALAATLLAFGSTLFIVDGVQSVAAGALRGLNDTRIPMIFAAVSFWVIGFATSYTLAFPARLEAVGVWIGFTVGLGVYALLLVWRFNVLTLRGYMPAAPGQMAH